MIYDVFIVYMIFLLNFKRKTNGRSIQDQCDGGCPNYQAPFPCLEAP